MSEVQALELRITDNASQTASALGALARTLDSLKNTLSGANFGGLKTVATSIEKIAGVTIKTETITALEKYASAMERIGNALANIKGLGGVSNAIAASGTGTAATNVGKIVKANGATTVAPRTMNVEAQEAVNQAKQTAAAATAAQTVKEQTEKAGQATQEVANRVQQVSKEEARVTQELEKQAAFAKKIAEFRESGKRTMITSHVTRNPDNTYAPGPRDLAAANVRHQEWAAQQQAIREAQSAAGQYKVSGIMEARNLEATMTQNAYEASLRETIRSAQELVPTLEKYQQAQTAVNNAQKQGLITAEQANRLNQQYEAGVASVTARIEQAKVAAAQQAPQPPPVNMEAISEGMKAVTTETKRAHRSIIEFVNGIKPMNNALTSMFKGLVRVAKYRLFRYIITQITKAVKEGIENFRGYSKAIKGLYDKDMTALDNIMLKMKNSVGAAIAPAFQALIPIIQTVVNWVITASNYVTQFFALLRGDTTWSKALDVTASDFEKTKNSANGAAKAAKELLASWDELNIISQEGGSGSGSKTLTDADYKKMYEETNVFNGKVKEIVGWIKDNMNAVKDIIREAGILLGTWTVGTAIGGIFSVLGSLLAAAGIIEITFKITTLLDDKYYSSGGEIGWLIADVLTAFIGASLAQKVLAGVLGVGAAEVVAGITLIVSVAASLKAFIENEDMNALSQTNIQAILGTALKSVAGAYLITKGLAQTSWGAATLAKGAAFKAGAGALFATVGIMVGIKAIQAAVKGEGWTQQEIKELFISSISLGGGAALIAATFGAGIAASLAIGGAAVVLAAATIAIVVAVNTKTEPGVIDWGGVTMAEEEVKRFVSTRMFTADAEAKINVMKLQIEGFDTASETLSQEIVKSQSKLDVLVLGVNTEESKSDLITEILGENADGKGGLIGSVTAKIKQMKGIITLDVSIFGGKSDEELTNIFGDLSYMEQWFAQQGADLGQAFKDGATDKIREISDEIIKMSYAVEYGKTRSGIETKQAELENQYRDQENFTQETLNSILEWYETMQQDTYNSYLETSKRAVATYRGMEEFFRQAGDETRAKYYKELADAELLKISGDENTEGSVAYMAKQAAEPGGVWLKEFLLKHMNGNLSMYDEDEGGSMTDLRAIMARVQEAGGGRQQFEEELIQYWIENDNGKEVFKDAWPIVKTLIGLGNFQLADVFKPKQMAEWAGGLEAFRNEELKNQILEWYDLGEDTEIEMPELFTGVEETITEAADEVAAAFTESPLFKRMMELEAQARNNEREAVQRANETQGAGLNALLRLSEDSNRPTGSAAEMEGFRRYMINLGNTNYNHVVPVNNGALLDDEEEFSILDSAGEAIVEHLSDMDILRGAVNAAEWDAWADYPKTGYEETFKAYLRAIGNERLGYQYDEGDLEFTMYEEFIDALTTQLEDFGNAEAAKTVLGYWETLAADYLSHNGPDEQDNEEADIEDGIRNGTAGTEARLDENNRQMLIMNNLLTQILNKPNSFTFNPTPSLGRAITRSLEMSNRAGGLSGGTGG